ncbi:hypothetical protein SLEP1_g49313 [Rubroshorea leprosula]|uniref:Sulfotransferase n=1 Tax=Rubroshorea leprosula TaxID=152421 RepID=A0AAV5LWK5_9ROSI|nr:hypothetical protein SLEP1_g49313 [Rubroshorea leprosula]
MDQCQSSNVRNDQEVVYPEAVDRIRGIISTLPIENGCRYIEPSCLYQGFWCHPSMAECIMLGQEFFKAEPNDIFVCSPPKSGTTWIKALTFAIVTRTCFDSSTSPLLFKMPHECVPAFHRSFGKKPDIREPGLPLIATHCPYASLPKSVLHSDGRLFLLLVFTSLLLLGSSIFGQKMSGKGIEINQIQNFYTSLEAIKLLQPILTEIVTSQPRPFPTLLSCCINNVHKKRVQVA